jgi:F0F1-type ATP synthase assembly protein I
MSNQNKKQRNKWLSLVSIPIQIGAVIFVFVYIGQFIDVKYPNDNNVYTKIFTVVGVFLSMFSVIRQVNEINKNE